MLKAWAEGTKKGLKSGLSKSNTVHKGHGACTECPRWPGGLRPHFASKLRLARSKAERTRSTLTDPLATKGQAHCLQSFNCKVWPGSALWTTSPCSKPRMGLCACSSCFWLRIFSVSESFIKADRPCNLEDAHAAQLDSSFPVPKSKCLVGKLGYTPANSKTCYMRSLGDGGMPHRACQLHPTGTKFCRQVDTYSGV